MDPYINFCRILFGGLGFVAGVIVCFAFPLPSLIVAAILFGGFVAGTLLGMAVGAGAYYLSQRTKRQAPLLESASSDVHDVTSDHRPVPSSNITLPHPNASLEKSSSVSEALHTDLSPVQKRSGWSLSRFFCCGKRTASKPSQAHASSPLLRHG